MSEARKRKRRKGKTRTRGGRRGQREGDTGIHLLSALLHHAKEERK